MVVQVGLDFGTTSSKAVIALPYHSGAPSFAVPVPSFASAEDHPHLWNARLWLGRDEKFTLWPTPEAIQIDNIKRNLMLPGAGTIRVDSVDPEAAACAFLALQLRQVRGWVACARREVLGEATVDWHTNLGFPAASLDDARLAQRFRRVCAAALQLNESGAEVSIDTVAAALKHVGPDSARQLAALGGNLVPEIAAAVAGFAYSARLEMGLFALVDIGGSTVDCCTFNLYAPKDGDLGCFIFAAKVDLLGVEPWRLCERDDSMRGEFIERLERVPRDVLGETRRRRYQQSPRWQAGLPVFVTGGGAASQSSFAGGHQHAKGSPPASRSARGTWTMLAPIRARRSGSTWQSD